MKSRGRFLIVLGCLAIVSLCTLLVSQATESQRTLTSANMVLQHRQIPASIHLKGRQMPSIRALKGQGMPSKELHTKKAVTINGNLAVPMSQASKTAAKKPAGPRYREGEVLVGFKKGIKAQAIDEMLSTKRLDKKKKFPVISRLKGKEYMLVKGDGKDAAELRDMIKQDPSVESATLNYAGQFLSTCEGNIPDDELFDFQWPFCNKGQEIFCFGPDPEDCVYGTPDADIDATEAWDIQTGSEDVVAVVFDTGVAYNHPDLTENMWVNKAEAAGIEGVDDDENGYIDDIYGYDVGEDDPDPMDSMGHGTHIAGTIAARGNNGIGVAGVNWNARIMAVKVATADYGLYLEDVLEGIEYITTMKKAGVNIVAVNCSWGFWEYMEIMEEAMDEAGKLGVIFVAAAGNDADDNDNGVVPNPYPASFDLDNIVSVAATDWNDNLTSFSNYGLTSVDLGAPGSMVLSTIIMNWYWPGEGNDIFFDNMEEGPDKWNAKSPWEIIQWPQYDPENHVWTDSPDGNYASNTESGLATIPIDLSEATGQLMLGFWMQIDLEAMADWLDISYKGPSGTWDTLFGITGTTEPDVWYILNIPIFEEYYWSGFQVKFTLHSDDQNNFDGVYLDNVGVGIPEIALDYVWMDGTSMAAPHVTGALALMAAEYPEEGPDTLIQRILLGVDPVPSLDGKVATGGRLNLRNSLQITFNEPPDCAHAYPSIAELWPPNHKMVEVNILGITDPDNDPVNIRITGITSDEPTDSEGSAGDDRHSPDADGIGTDTAMLRAERSGKGNGRVYKISFIASDPDGAECSGSITVCVPHDQRPVHKCVDDGQLYDATKVN